MQNININEGFKYFSINNDENRVICFNPSDINIISRIQKAAEALENITAEDIKLKADGTPTVISAAEAVEDISRRIKEQIDFIFDSPVSDTVFRNQSPLSSVGGVPFYERFLEAVIPVIQREVSLEKQASLERADKYIRAVKK